MQLMFSCKNWDITARWCIWCCQTYFVPFSIWGVASGTKWKFYMGHGFQFCSKVSRFWAAPTSITPSIEDRCSSWCLGPSNLYTVEASSSWLPSSALSFSLDSREPPVVPIPREGGIRGGGEEEEEEEEEEETGSREATAQGRGAEAGSGVVTEW